MSNGVVILMFSRFPSTIAEVALSNYSAGLSPLQDLLQAETTWRQALSTTSDSLASYRNAILAYQSLF